MASVDWSLQEVKDALAALKKEMSPSELLELVGRYAADWGSLPSDWGGGPAAFADFLTEAVRLGHPERFVSHCRLAGCTGPAPGRKEAWSMVHAPDTTDDTWNCICVMSRAFPKELALAVHNCVSRAVDPTALGAVDAAIAAAERCACCDGGVLAQLTRLYMASGLGLWPRVRLLLDEEYAERRLSRELGAGRMCRIHFSGGGLAGQLQLGDPSRSRDPLDEEPLLFQETPAPSDGD